MPTLKDKVINHHQQVPYRVLGGDEENNWDSGVYYGK